MERSELINAATKTAKDIVKNETTKGNLAETLLKHMALAIETKVPVDIIWTDIARKLGYADKAAKLDGMKMPGTLATYRSAHRKGLEMGVSFAVTWPEFQKSLKPKKDETPGETGETETETTGGDEVQLTSIVVPRGIAEIMERYERLRVADPVLAVKFMNDMNATAMAWEA